MNRIRITLLAALSVLPLLWVPSVAVAQSTASQETTIPGGMLVLGTYFGFVAMMFGYLAVLHIRQRRLDQDILVLEKRLDDLAGLQ